MSQPATFSPRSDDLVQAVVALAELRGAGDSRAARVLKTIVPHYDARETSSDELVRWTWNLTESLGIPPGERASRIAAARARGLQAAERAARADLFLLPWFAPAYPALLRAIVDPPIALWGTGHLALLAEPAVAVVGSRQATPAGESVARQLASELARAGLVVVSGMARGIDAAAHQGALSAGGRTIAVLGCGADVVYPPQHGALASRIRESGLILSEFSPGAPPLPAHFPLRNRIISGLSWAIVIVEASDRSGSLITARLGLEQGRDVLAVPGNVLSGRYRGCHALLKDGARLVETVEDILDEIGWVRAPERVAQGKSSEISHLEQQMATGEPYSVDDLATRTGRGGPELLAELAALEIDGRVGRTPDGSFIRLDESGTDRSNAWPRP